MSIGPRTSLPGVTGSLAVVTGAAQGIGEAIARAMAAHGARVALVDRNEARVNAVADELVALGARAVAVAADVSSAPAVESAIERIDREFAPIQILVNGAGVLRPGAAMSLADEDWSATFDVNATGVFLISRAVAKRMIPRRSGTIITIGSNATGVTRMGMAAYAASKAAATLFTKCLGLELAEHGIRCNVVSPGSTDTPMQRSLWTDPSDAARVIAGAPEKFRAGIPLGKLARPDDVAHAVLFLASDHASQITMHDLYVDGGATLRA